MKKYNPFRPNSIVNTGMFHGRIRELEIIEQCLFQTANANPQHFLIEGERGIGKSSLMVFVEAVASGRVETLDNEKYNFLVINLELKNSMTYFDISRQIGLQLKREIDRKEPIKTKAKRVWDFLTNWEILGVKYQKTPEGLDHLSLLDDLTTVIEDLIKDTEGGLDGLLILIDEADKPSSDANLGELVKLFTERLSKRGCNKVCLGLAGLPTLLSKLKESHESSLRVFTVLSLDPLEKEDRESVISSALKDANSKNKIPTEITSEAMEEICDLSEGYPHFLQQFGYSAFDADSDNILDKKDVRAGAFDSHGAMEQLGSKYFHDLYFAQINSDDYRKVLQAMATKQDNWTSRADIIQISGIKQTTVTNALQALKNKNIIIANEKKAGEYRLPTKSFAAWIKAASVAPTLHLQSKNKS